MNPDELGKVVGTEIAKAVDGCMDAMVIFGLLVIKTTKVNDKRFVGILDEAVQAFNKEGKPYASQILQGVSKRLKDGL